MQQKRASHYSINIQIYNDHTDRLDPPSQQVPRRTDDNQLSRDVITKHKNTFTLSNENQTFVSEANMASDNKTDIHAVQE